MKAKITIVPKNSEEQGGPTICFFPGGPGLSSKTLRSMDVLSRSFELAFVDPPGTGGLEEVSAPTFEGILGAMEVELEKLGNRSFIFIGHSFGALYAIELAARKRINVCGLAIIAAPLSEETYEIAKKQYVEFMTPELSDAIEKFDDDKTKGSFNQLLSRYGRLYFSEETIERGGRLLLSDETSVESFIHVLPTFSRRTPFVDFIGHLRDLAVPKFMIAGAVDLLFPASALEADARLTDCRFFKIQDAGHFVTFDQPEAVTALIEEIFLGGNVRGES